MTNHIQCIKQGPKSQILHTTVTTPFSGFTSSLFTASTDIHMIIQPRLSRQALSQVIHKVATSASTEPISKESIKDSRVKQYSLNNSALPMTS